MNSQLATFTLAGAHFGIDMLRVQEAMRGPARTRVPLAEPSVAGLINLRGQVILTIDLRTRLGLEALSGDLEPMMVVVQVAGEPIGLLVDDVGDVVNVEDHRLEAPPDTLPIVYREEILGVYQLENSLLLVLDIDRVAGAEAASHLTRDH
jgi:purine-binding chemotaxis protein CheW